MQNKVLIYPLSAKRIVTVYGPDAKSFLHRLSTQDIISLQDGQSCVNLFCNSKGHLVDLVQHVQVNDQNCVLISAHADGTILKNWLEEFLFGEALSIDVAFHSNSFQCHSRKSGDPEHQNHMDSRFHGNDKKNTTLERFIENSFDAAFIFTQVPLSISGYSDLQIFFNPIWSQENAYLILNPTVIPVKTEIHKHAIVAEGKIVANANNHSDSDFHQNDITASPNLQLPENNMELIDDEALEIMRIQSGLGFGVEELKEQFNPVELGLERFVNLHKGCFVGQEVVAKLMNLDKCSRYLSAFVCPDAHTHEHLKDSVLFSLEHEELGQCTSVSPVHQENKICALSVLKKRHLAHSNGNILAKHPIQKTFFNLQVKKSHLVG